jgi:dTDP-4-dehydrorhamnose reductase
MRFLVIGCRGLLGGLFMARLGDRATGLDLPGFDLSSGGAAIRSAVRGSGAGVVINCAALTDVDYCETHRDEAFRIHSESVSALAESSPSLVTFSTDQVFSGPSDTPFVESDPVSPANAYAQSKLEGERAALCFPGALVVRTSWLFGADRGLLPWLRNKLLREGAVRAVADQTACVTWAPDLVGATLEMIGDGASGLFHAVNPGEASPFSLACELAASTGGVVEPTRWVDLDLPARRPVYSALGTAKDYVLPGREESMDRWMEGL